MSVRYRVTDPGLRTTAVRGSNPTTISEPVLRVPRDADHSAAVTTAAGQPERGRKSVRV